MRSPRLARVGDVEKALDELSHVGCWKDPIGQDELPEPY